MNVIVWSSWVSRPVGGMERVALELALQLHARNHHVVLIGAYDNAPELRAQIPEQMAYYYFDIHRRRLKPHLAAGRLLARVIREHSIQVVSAHGSIFAAHEVCRRRRIPLIWTIHGAMPRPRGPFGRLKTLAVARVLYNSNSHTVAVSHATAQIIHRQFPRLDQAHLHVIHNGIIDEAALAALPLPQPSAPWQLGFVGRLAERKRPLDLVEVAHKLDGQLNFKMHVFGEGPLEQSLRAAIGQQQVENRFALHGYWDKGSPGMVKQFQILVHTDSMEPFGGALLEAQLGGRPVVAYRVGGNPEIVEHGVTGWLAPLGDTNGLAEGVRTVAGRDFTGFSVAARQRAMKLFPMSRMTEQYEDLFGRLCAKN